VIFAPTDVEGVFVVERDLIEDERGHFATIFREDEFAARGLVSEFAQCNTSRNTVKGTLRGMHYADPPEVKLVRCTRGRVFDVVLDLRPDSPSYRKWDGAELSPDNGLAMYVPTGVAHGFYTLEDDSEVLYHISLLYDPGAARGVRWDDPAFGIQWPGKPTVISERDHSFPDITL
jgi:dTDP-4-dehydrorhamnose 3,5-epimerase